MAVNYFIDPGRLFHQDDESRIADLMLKDMNVANISNFDDRLVQKYYIQGMQQSKDVILLGSSRTMVISSRMFPGQSFYNHSVTSGVFEDYIAIYELYVQRGLSPQKIVVGLDPWMLNKNHDLKYWETLHPEYKRGLADLGIEVQDGEMTAGQKSRLGHMKRYIELLSPTYFQQSYKMLAQALPELRLDMYPTQEWTSPVQMRRADGSRNYAKAVEERSIAEARNLAVQYVNATPVFAMGNFERLDPTYQKIFEAWVERMQKNGVEVIFLLSPYHPYVYPRLAKSDEYKIVLASQEYFLGVARDKNISVLGSYNPAETPCVEIDFYDGVHPRPICYEKILRPQ